MGTQNGGRLIITSASTAASTRLLVIKNLPVRRTACGARPICALRIKLGKMGNALIHVLEVEPSLAGNTIPLLDGYIRVSQIIGESALAAAHGSASTVTMALASIRVMLTLMVFQNVPRMEITIPTRLSTTELGHKKRTAIMDAEMGIALNVPMG